MYSFLYFFFVTPLGKPLAAVSVSFLRNIYGFRNFQKIKFTASHKEFLTHTSQIHLKTSNTIFPMIFPVTSNRHKREKPLKQNHKVVLINGIVLHMTGHRSTTIFQYTLSPPPPHSLSLSRVRGVRSTSSFYVAVCSCVGAFPPGNYLRFRFSHLFHSPSRELFCSRCQIEWKAANQTMAFDIRYPIFTLLTLPWPWWMCIKTVWKMFCWLVWWFNLVSSSSSASACTKRNVISTTNDRFSPQHPLPKHQFWNCSFWPWFKRQPGGNLASHQFYQFQFRPISANRLKNKSALCGGIAQYFVFVCVCLFDHFSTVHKQLQLCKSKFWVLFRNRLWCNRLFRGKLYFVMQVLVGIQSLHFMQMFVSFPPTLRSDYRHFNTMLASLFMNILRLCTTELWLDVDHKSV